MKKLLLVSMLAVATSAIAAGGYYGPGGTPLINSIGASTNYNPAVINTNRYWPASLPGGTTITNVTPFTANGDTIVFQLNCQVTTPQSATATNVIFQIGRSVEPMSSMPAGGVTNSFGAGLNIDWFATVTNTLPSSAAANTTYTSTAEFSLPTGFTTGSAGGAPYYYIGYIQPPANATVTNYQVFFIAR